MQILRQANQTAPSWPQRNRRDCPAPDPTPGTVWLTAVPLAEARPRCDASLSVRRRLPLAARSAHASSPDLEATGKRGDSSPVTPARLQPVPTDLHRLGLPLPGCVPLPPDPGRQGNDRGLRAD